MALSPFAKLGWAEPSLNVTGEFGLLYIVSGCSNAPEEIWHLAD